MNCCCDAASFYLYAEMTIFLVLFTCINNVRNDVACDFLEKVQINGIHFRHYTNWVRHSSSDVSIIADKSTTFAVWWTSECKKNPGKDTERENNRTNVILASSVPFRLVWFRAQNHMRYENEEKPKQKEEKKKAN